MSLLENLHTIANRDVKTVFKKNQEYGESWCRRGGQQAFAVIWRKADRIESIISKMNNGYDIFEAWERNPGDVRDDLRDLRQYLLLLEEYLERDEMPTSGGLAPTVVRATTDTRRPHAGGTSSQAGAETDLPHQLDSGYPRGRGYVSQD